MRLAALMLAAALSFPAIAAPSSENNSFPNNPTVVAMDVPGTQFRKPVPPILEREDSPTWDDTADTSDEIEIKPEQDLNNDVHDPLLESPIREPDESPRDILDSPLDDEPHHPLSEPIP